MTEQHTQPAAAIRAGLTDREYQVLELIAEGLGNGSIARRLHLSEDTVKTHCRRLFRKLRADTRTGAVVNALRSGVLILDAIDIAPAGSKLLPQRAACHPHRDTTRSVRLVADDHDAALLSAAMFGPTPSNGAVALQRSRQALERLVGGGAR